VKLKPVQLVPYVLAALAIAVVLGTEGLSHWFPRWDLVQRLKWMTYDWRARQAVHFAAPATNNLGFVFFSDETISIFSEGVLGTNYQYGLYWPRHLYGQVVRELAAQGAKMVGLDVLFSERRHEFDQVQVRAGTKVFSSDAFFQYCLGEAGNVALGATSQTPPHGFFRVAAADLGDISTDKDADGVLRRVKPFKEYRLWHEAIRMKARIDNLDLAAAAVRSNAVFLSKPDQSLVKIPLEDGFFNPGLLAEGGAAQTATLQPAFQEVRVWHMGIVLAAKALGLDLEQAQVERRRIVLTGANGLTRSLPLDSWGCLPIDWVMLVNDPRLTEEAFDQLLAKDITRQLGTNYPPRFKDKLVVIGSMAEGNDLSDRGATPIEKNGFLTCNIWNVANSVLTGRFIRQASDSMTVLLILALGGISAAATLKLRPSAASAMVVLAGALLWGAGLWLFIAWRYWLPLVTPLAALLLTHVTLLSYRVVFEQSERRRIRGIFTKIVSPDVVSELLQAERLSLGGARREVTVFFTDVRGFTEYTDANHALSEEHVRRNQLSPAAAAAWIDAQSQEVLRNVNLYLGTIADIIKKHNGTLDKYIGDCVMAFWGAPTPNPQHALAGVRAAIDAQRAIFALNQERFAENQRREKENPERAQRGEAPLPPLPLLALGSGINTGIVTVGLMGSDAHLVNYTVFGREVNLASRLESYSGRSRILIGEMTFQALRQWDPALAGACAELPPVTVKGFRDPVKVFEVPWKTPAPAAAEPQAVERAASGA
jgi:class 3 adenylate cyclase/CHASE2 domain-containing sensor protein